MKAIIIRYTAGLLLIGIAVWFLFQQPDVLASLKQIAWSDLIGLLLLSLLILFTLGVQFDYLIRAFGLRLPLHEWLGLTAVNSMFNYYLPARGGLIARGAYLKRKYDFPWSRYVSLVIVSQVVMLGAVAFLGLVFLIICRKECSNFYWELVSLFGGVLLITVSIYQILPRLAKQLVRFPLLKPFLRDFTKGLTDWRQDRWVGIRFLGLVVVLVFLWGLRLYSCFLAIGAPVEFWKIMIIQTMISLSFIISMTPGNLGIKEGLTALSAKLVDISPTTALLASLVDRAVAILIIFATGLFFSHFLMHELKKTCD